MRALLDVNILLALFQPSHVHHQSAHQWLETAQGEGWASSPLIQNGFVRIVSQPRYEGALTIREALRRLDLFIERTDHEFWPDDTSLLDQDAFVHDRILGPKQVTDIYLLGLAVKHGGRLATFDESIPLRAAKGAEPQHLAIVPKV